MESCMLCAIFGDTFFDDGTGKRLYAAKVEAAKQRERDALWSWPVFVNIDYRAARKLGLQIIKSRGVLTEKTN